MAEKKKNIFQKHEDNHMVANSFRKGRKGRTLEEVFQDHRFYFCNSTVFRCN